MWIIDFIGFTVFAGTAVHLFPLLRCGQQFQRRVVAYWHIVEEPYK